MLIKLIRSNITYTIGSVANSAAQLILVPFLINTLSTVEYGVWAILEVTIILLNMFIAAGLDIGLMREYWPLQSEKERGILAGTVIMTVGIWGLFLLGFAASLFQLGLLTRFVQASRLSFLLAILAALLESLSNLTLTIFRIREEAIKFVGLSFSRMFIFMCSAVILVRSGQGVEGAVGGRALAAFAALVFGIFLLRRFIHLGFHWAYLKRVVAYGFPMLPANLAANILLASDRYFLQFFSSAEVVGIYSFSYKITSLYEVLINRPFALDWAPRRFKIANQKNAPQKYAFILLAYLFVGVFGILAILAVAPNLYGLLAPKVYWGGLNVLPVLLFSVLIYGLSYPLTIGIVIKDKTHYAAIIGWIAAGLCLAFNYWLIPRYGMMGAAWATVFSYAVWTFGMTVVSLRLYPVPYPVKMLAGILLPGALGYIGLNWLMQHIGSDFLSLPLFLIRFSWLALMFAFVGVILFRYFKKEIYS
jgi:O-antigen/teichoic acid export membrane protein